MRESSKIQEITVHLTLNVPIEWDNRFSCTILSNQKCSVTIAPLKKTQKIPEFLKDYNCCPEIFYSLPVVLKDGKMFAYPCMKHNSKSTSDDEIKYFIASIIKENLLKLTDI